MQAFDTHCHLGYDDPALALAEHARAIAAGVTGMLCVGTNSASSQRARELSHLQGVRWSAGLHPNDAMSFATEWPVITELCRSAGCAAIGETGLDCFRDRTPLDQQQASLHAHLALSRELDLPVILHCRSAFAPLFAALQSEPACRGVMHCFSGTIDEVRASLDLGLYISFAGPLTYPKNDALRAAARFAPADRILVETDSPFLPPQQFRGKRNEPAFVMHTLHVLANARGITQQAAAELTFKNAIALFG